MYQSVASNSHWHKQRDFRSKAFNFLVGSKFSLGPSVWFYFAIEKGFPAVFHFSLFAFTKHLHWTASLCSNLNFSHHNLWYYTYPQSHTYIHSMTTVHYFRKNCQNQVQDIWWGLDLTCSHVFAMPPDFWHWNKGKNKLVKIPRIPQINGKVGLRAAEDRRRQAAGPRPQKWQKRQKKRAKKAKNIVV